MACYTIEDYAKMVEQHLTLTNVASMQLCGANGCYPGTVCNSEEGKPVVCNTSGSDGYVFMNDVKPHEYKLADKKSGHFCALTHESTIMCNASKTDASVFYVKPSDTKTVDIAVRHNDKLSYCSILDNQMVCYLSKPPSQKFTYSVFG